MSATLRILAVGLLILVAVLGLFALRPTALERVEMVLLDGRFNLRGPVPPTQPIAVVAFDHRSIDEFGWRRDVIAEVLERLEDADAAAIGVDIVFSNAAAASQDERLEQAVADAGNLVLGFYFRTRDEGAAPGNAMLAESLSLVEAAKVRITKLPASGRLPVLSCRDVEPNLARFNHTSQYMGFFSAIKDLDGSVRRSALVGSCGGELYSSLPLAIAEAATGERAVLLGNARGIEQIRLGERSIPTDPGGRIVINYRGPAGSFEHFSVADILNNQISPERLRGKILIVGTTEPGIMDVHPTPFDASFPGVEVHANIVDSILSGNAISRTDGLVLVEVGLMIALALLLSLVIPRMRGALAGAAFALGLLTLLVAGGLWAFVQNGIWLNLTYPALTLVSVYVGVAIMQNMRVSRDNRDIREKFETYVAPAVVDEMIRRPDSFRLGGEYRNLSMLFSDIRDFTSLAEEIGAESVVRLLNAYLTPMTELVKSNGGTLDKYIGDAVVAFWGAPVAVENHPTRACETALAMRDELRELHHRRSDLVGMDRLRIGIGIHSADVAVGNMGSPHRFDYTIIGDGMNLCSRLEGLNRYYGTEIIASSDLVDRIGADTFRRELDTIRVKGRNEGVRIYEILGHDPPDPGDIEFFDAYATALAAYREGSWEEARRALIAAISLRGGDAGCEMLLGRIQSLEKEPPDDWNGVWVFDTK